MLKGCYAMQKFIGTKLIEAEPCPAWKDFGKHKTGDPGYKSLFKIF